MNLLTVVEVATLCERSSSWVRKIERAGDIKAVRVGHGERLFFLQEVERYVAVRAARQRERDESRRQRKQKTESRKTGR